MASLYLFRGIQTVKPHVPLIQFPKRFPLESLFPLKPSGSTDLDSQKVRGDRVDRKTETSNFNVLEETELPIKYKRATILPEEIAYIERGGPD